MTEDKLSIGGAVVFWRLAKSTNRQAILDGLGSLGLSEYVPEPRTKLACLRATLPDVYPPREKGVKHNVRPVKNGVSKGFAVVKEKADDVHAGDDWGTVVATAKLHNETDDLDLDPFDTDHYGEIRHRMDGAANWLTNTSIGTALVKLVEEHCDGVALRPNGGVYWVRDDRLDEWSQIADVFETAQAAEDGGTNAVYVLKVVADEQMVRAVGDALTAEISTELAQIEADIADGDLLERACLSRLRRVGGLESKVQRYEQAFASPLDKLRAAVSGTSRAVAQATLQAGAAAIA